MSEPAQTIVVTGASGFVGRQIVRQLLPGGHRLRALVRKAPREPLDPAVTLATGDLGNPETYAAALEGASVVVHAALTDDLSQEPQATSALCARSAQAGVRKFIHLSSIAIYGNPLSGTITEETAPLPSADQYSRTKLAIEQALPSAARGMDLVVLRLGCVYGPGNGWWTGGLLHQMHHGKVILVNGGTGIANLIHVSDAALLVSLAIEHAPSALEVFNAADGAPVEWRRYFAELEKIAGVNATVSMSESEARAHAGKWLRPSLVRRIFRKLTGAPFVYPLDDQAIQNYASRAVYSNRKAAAALGFTPQYGLESGMRSVQAGASFEQPRLVTQ